MSSILSALLDALLEWVSVYGPRAYRDGAQEAAEPRPGSIDLNRSEHRETVQALGEEMADSARKAVSEMRDDANSQLREIARQRAMESLSTGTRPEPYDAEEPRFTDRRGRKWAADDYVEMAARTFVARTRNAGHLNAAAEIGSPGVLIRDGGNPVRDGRECDPCAEADGQKWSLSYFAAHLLEHPRCRRSASALAPGMTVELDKE